MEKWEGKCYEAFQKLKDIVTNAPILVGLDRSKPFCRHVDASQMAVGGTLRQVDEQGRNRVTELFSKELAPSERNYTVNDRELLALVEFFERLRCYLEGSELEILTDNQVLKHFFPKS